MLIGPITRARAKKLQDAINRLFKVFIWANPALEKQPTMDQSSKECNSIKDGQKALNVILVIEGNDQGIFGNCKALNDKEYS